MPDLHNLPDLSNFTPARLREFCRPLGLSVRQADRVFSWLQRPGVHDFERMTGIGKKVRVLLAAHARLCRLQPAVVERSADGTVKFAFRLHDGAVIESVLIPEQERHTLCLSSQAGCAMGCRFCLTGGLGAGRNLAAGEMVNQVMAVLEYMIGAGIVRATPRELINNLVFMGMGEPLANYDNLLAALAILMAEQGLEFSGRRITVSTCGLVPGIRALGRDTLVNLAVSLHAADDALRSSLMPVNRRYGIAELLAACREFPLRKKGVVLIEYILLAGINDSLADARLLAEKLRGLKARINLLPANEAPGLPFGRPGPEVVLAFQKVLREAGYNTFVRQSRGADIAAACGQLAGKHRE
jgi:23S rRNA (adenine2503-C2)-methyltransferase